MRLQEMSYLIEVYGPQLRLQSEPVKNFPGKQSITRMDELRLAVRKLSQIPFLRATAESIIEHPVFRIADGMTVEDDYVASFSRILSPLLQLVGNFRPLLLVAATPKGSDSVHIKLPKLTSLRDLADFAKSMDLIFDKPARHLFGEGVEFAGFDVGSDWLIVSPVIVDVAKTAGEAVMAAGGVAVVVTKAERIRDFIFSFLNAYQEWRMKNVRYQWSLAQLENFKGAVEFAKEMRAKQAEIAEQEKELIVKQLVDAQASGANVPEVCNLATLAMTELDKWVQRGAEVHPSLGAPEPVRKLLPEPVTAIAPTPKQLTEGSTDDPEKKS